MKRREKIPKQQNRNDRVKDAIAGYPSGGCQPTAEMIAFPDKLDPIGNLTIWQSNTGSD